MTDNDLNALIAAADDDSDRHPKPDMPEIEALRGPVGSRGSKAGTWTPGHESGCESRQREDSGMDTDAIKARTEEATEGPWGRDQVYGLVAPTQIDGYAFPLSRQAAKDQTERDSEFVAHARQDIPDLLTEVQRLTDERDRLVARVARVEALCQGPVVGGYQPYAVEIGESGEDVHLAVLLDDLRAALAGDRQ